MVRAEVSVLRFQFAQRAGFDATTRIHRCAAFAISTSICRSPRGRTLQSIFFGGGTPSLFSPDNIARILDATNARLDFASDIEITLETNPGTVEHGPFADYRNAGVNRISFGVQSFDDEALKRIGRIHNASEAERAVKMSQDAGLDNINIDLMYALPNQTLAAALADIDKAITLRTPHLSHYQLTLEPNTPFAANPPPLPDDDSAWDMQEACQARLADAGLMQYEVSAYARDGAKCRHNLNYWNFGDYLGIGAGAHGKYTDSGWRDSPSLESARAARIPRTRRHAARHRRRRCGRARTHRLRIHAQRVASQRRIRRCNVRIAHRSFDR